MPFRVARCWAMEVPITYEGAESAGSSFCWKIWKVHSSWCRSKSRRLDVIGQTTDGAFSWTQLSGAPTRQGVSISTASNVCWTALRLKKFGSRSGCHEMTNFCRKMKNARGASVAGSPSERPPGDEHETRVAKSVDEARVLSGPCRVRQASWSYLRL